MMAIETHLRQRKDVSGKVSTRQAVKLAWFQREQDKLLRAKKLKWYILDPQSIQVQMWDALTAIALIFTAIVTPLEVAFLPAPTCAHEGLFIVNRLIDVGEMVEALLGDISGFMSFQGKSALQRAKDDIVTKYN